MNGHVKAFALCAGLLVVAGCAETTGRQPLAGTVSFQGQPLDMASIDFTRVDPTEPALHCGAMVRGGRFDIPRESGVPPGRYRVVISAGGPPPAATPAAVAPGGESRTPPIRGANPFQASERIPARYNEASALFVDVTADKPNHFTFDLTDSK